MTSYEYAPFYCEENVYRLAFERFAARRIENPAAAAVRPDAFVVLISNPDESVALATQRAGRGPEKIVVWDYHVVYVEGAVVYDLDTVLPCPIDSTRYLARTFPSRLLAPESPHAARFSCVPAARFLEVFSSDRSHMRSADGSYIHAPPPWPSIYRPELGNTLFELVHGRHEAVQSYGRDFPR
ncbi:MAG: hypothetical protein ACLFUA_03445 [Spirochaetales bacterium]